MQHNARSWRRLRRLARSTVLLALGSAVCCLADCASPHTRLAQMELTISGDGNGCVDIDRVITDENGNICRSDVCIDGQCNRGTGGSAYDPHTRMTLTATPSRFEPSKFISWEITIYDDDGRSRHVTSSDTKLVIEDGGNQMDVVAIFELLTDGEGGVSDAGVSD